MDRIRKVDSNSGQLAADKIISHLELDDDSVYGEEDTTSTSSHKKKQSSSSTSTPPLFVVEMDYEIKHHGLPPILKFMPVKEKFKRRVERAVVGNLQVLSARLPRLLTHSKFELFVQPTIDEFGPFGESADVESILLDETSFSNMLETINTRMNVAFHCANIYAQSLIPFLNVYVENKNVLKGLTYDNYKNQHYDVFRDMITTHQNEVTMFTKIPTTTNVSFIQVNSIILKSQFTPSPNKVLQKIAKLLPNIASLRNTTVNKAVTDAHDITSHEPFNVGEFYRLCTFLQGFDANMIEMTEDHIFASEMYKLLNEFDIRTTEQQQTEHFMLEQSWQALLDSLEMCEDTHKTRKSHFIKELSKLVPKLNERVDKIRLALEDSRIRSSDVSSGDVLEYLDSVSETLLIETNTSKQYNNYQQLMGIPVLPWDDLEEITVDLNLKLKLWTTVQQWERSSTTWLAAIYDAIDADEVSKQMNVYRKTIQQCEYGLADEENPNLAIPKLKKDVMEFHETLPVVADLRCVALRERHWVEINQLLNFELNPGSTGINEANEEGDENEETKDEKEKKEKNASPPVEDDQDNGGFTLGQLMKKNIKKYNIEINTIATTAKAEASLELMLDKLIKVWKKLEFEMIPYKQRKNMYIVGGTDDILTVLDDSMVTVSTLLGSRYVGPIQPQVEDWHAKLTIFNETLEAWTSLQRNWAYLENIFNGPDIAKQLPSEDRLFKQVDGWYFEFMLNVARLPNCMECGTKHGVRDKMVEHVNTLDKVQKALEEFLETKRQVFPRFYFLSNDELLEILGQSKNARAVQPHMRKCFDAIVGLEFGDQPSGAIDIFAMISPEGENVQLTKNLKARGPVEEWLLEVEGSMRKALHDLFKQGVMMYQEMDRPLWIMESKAQVVASISQIMWCRGTASAIRAMKNSDSSSSSIQAWYNTNLLQLSQLTKAVRGSLTKIQRKTIVALCTVDVHARDIVKELMDTQIETTDDFKWQQQLRTYWEDDIDDCIVRQATATIPYGYEYMGACSRLVITPLTDRCWMTITSSLHLKLGAAPAGPAGTGKTESSKDLAKALGILCIVFNCSDQIDYKMTGKLFRGLAQQSAWTCLDEFNRIDIEVLSVVAQQLLVLRQARLSGTGRCNFEGLDIPVHSMHVIITMNPGYAGRTPLPDNLKVLFRPVAMMVPDYALIAEIMLFAEGFDDASNLSRKLWDLFKLSSEQLSQQKHYDYGLRAVKSVLVMAGAAKRANPTMVEDAVLIKAMRDSNVPKFLSPDLPLFYAIIGDLFPGIEAPYDTNMQLKNAVVDQIHARGYQSGEKFVHKVIQLFQVFNTRFGACLVGPAGGGKTSVYDVLKDACTDLGRECDTQKINSNDRPDLFNETQTLILNPKAITMGELYGEYNLLTQEWKDGCGSGLMRECVRLSYDSELRRWVVFDGPIDAVWIENMNTVLDDNCMLCLANGQRIKLTQKMRMLFEVENLDEASPATVSRIGVVYVPDTALGWQPIVTSWLEKMFPSSDYSTNLNLFNSETGEPISDDLIKEEPVVVQRVMKRIQQLFELLFVPAIQYRSKSCSQPVVTSTMNAATTVCSLMEAMLKYDGGAQFSGQGQPRTAIKDIGTHGQAIMFVERLFAFALVWGVAGSVSSMDRDEFDVYFTTLFEKLGCDKFLPGNGTSESCYDFWLDPCVPDGSAGKGDFKLWERVVPQFKYDEKAKFFDLVVPTVDTTCYSHLMELMVRDRKPVYLTGVTGTGKSVMATTLVDQLQIPIDQGGAGCAGIVINFSAKTSSQIIQGTIENSLERKTRTILGPPRGLSGTFIFVDDVNMPEVEIYGAQPPIELLRQLIDSGGFYEREEWLWRDIVSSVLCVAAAPPGGGRSAVTQRFVRHFMVLCVPDPSDEGLQRIFQNILDGFLTSGKFHGDLIDLSQNVVSSTIDLYGRIREELLPTPSRIHYQFNLRDVSKVFQGILMIERQQCTDVVTLSKLWLHESLRVFSDRLINDEDREYFKTLTIEMLNRYFTGSGLNWDMESVYDGQEAQENPIMFGHYLVPGAADIKYEQCKVMSKVQTLMLEYLEEYNDPTNQNAHMSLVFFRSAVDHISRISRILRQPRGNAMLVGQGGSGKQSTTRLGCVLAGATFTQIELTSTFGIFEFREALKEMMFGAGVEGTSIGFSLTDTQIVNEGFLEDVSSLLNSGSVPNLFESDEWEKIVVAMSNVCKDLGYESCTRDFCEKLFVSRVRDNLHVVLCLSPVGDKLRLRCLQFPSLINCCTIDWFSSWPDEALFTVAKKALAAVDLPDEKYPELRIGLINGCVHFHQCALDYSIKFNAELGRNVYITPCSYLDLLNVYQTLLKEGRHILQVRIDTLTLGVNKLEETNSVVNKLQKELTTLQPILKSKAKEAETLLKRVAIEKEEAEVVRVRVSADEAEVKAQAAEVQIITADAQKDLDKAIPALNGAIKALNALDKKDLQELKAFSNPPPAVALVMEGVNILLGKKPEWKEAKLTLGMMDLMDQLKNYDKDNISPAILKKIKKYVVHEDMQVDRVAQVSSAAKSLCMWVHAMNTYSIVAKEVGPKKAKVAEMTDILNKANATLAEKQAELKDVQDKVAALQKSCDDTEAEKKRLIEETNLTKKRLERATKLTSGLATEQVRWKKDRDALIKGADTLIGDMFLSAGSVSYVGPFTGVYRERIVSFWLNKCAQLNIPFTGALDGGENALALKDEANSTTTNNNKRNSSEGSEGSDDEMAKKITGQVLQTLVNRAAARGSEDGLRLAFESLDENGDGVIEPDEFERGLAMLNIHLTKDKLKMVFDLIDDDNSGALTIDEFEEAIGQQKLSFALSTVLGNPVSILEWQINGLPTDSVSTDNAIMVERSKRWPLLIDPQQQANRWIRNIEQKKGLSIIKATDIKLARALESAMRMGNPFLVEDLGELLLPALDPVLIRPEPAALEKGSVIVRFGDQEVEWHNDFRLYLTTTLPNPHYMPEVCIKVVVINFTVTFEGLQEQLLGDVVKNERPELEKRKRQLVLSMAEDRKQLDAIEKRILTSLTQSQGNILDDVRLIATLGEAKTTAALISNRVVDSEKAEHEINETRAKYVPASTRGSILYFIITDLGNVDPMYQYSLEYFQKVFKQCIKDAAPSANLDERLENLISYQTSTIYSNICRGLFVTHRLTFSLIICKGIMVAEGNMMEKEWQLFIKGAGIVDRTLQVHENPFPAHGVTSIGPLQWDQICTMNNDMEGFDKGDGLCVHITQNIQQWIDWLQCPEPHLTMPPLLSSGNVSAENKCNDNDDGTKEWTTVQRLLLIRTLSESKTVFGASEFVKMNMGEEFIVSNATTMSEIENDMDNATPCIFVLSAGSDPTQILLTEAKLQGMDERLHVISLGQGQGPKATALIERSSTDGDWVLLQNCHLAKSWMPGLEKIVTQLGDKAHSNHEEFRLFLTSMPVSYFPTPVLQNGIKMTNEPPKGLRNNMLRSFDQVVPGDNLEEVPDSINFETCSKPREWKRLVFSLTFFHAFVQERRKFGPLGWNIQYEFNDSDLETSIQSLRLFLDSPMANVPWAALKYVTGAINYGGRVTDDWDRRTLMAIMEKFYSKEVITTDQQGFLLANDGKGSNTYVIPCEEDILKSAAVVDAAAAAAAAVAGAIDATGAMGDEENVEEETKNGQKEEQQIVEKTTPSRSDYRNIVTKWPLEAPPQVFGMHRNAEISFQLKESNDLVRTIVTMSGGGGGGESGGANGDQEVTETASKLRDVLPVDLDRDLAAKGMKCWLGGWCIVV